MKADKYTFPQPNDDHGETTMKAFNIAIASALLLTGGTATAQSASDAQCIIVSNAFASQSKDAEQQKVAQASMYFFLGRISSTTTAAQLKTLLDAQMKTINNTNAGETMNKCLATIKSRVDMLESLDPDAKPATPAKPGAPAQPHR
jgi:hypothetical protein